jgi:hypothetical protein
VKISALVCALLFSLPSVCEAYGDPTGAAGLALFLAAVTAGAWILICVVAFFLMRKTSVWKRLVYCLALFITPLVLVALDMGSDYLAGHVGDQSQQTAARPVVFAGVTFPPGSRIVDEQTDSNRWHKRIVQVESDTAVSLGPLKIVGLRQEESTDNDSADIALAGDQLIDGWPCSAAVGYWTAVSLHQRPSEPHLRTCWLSKAREIKPVIWPAYSNVSIGPGDEWNAMWERTSVRDAPPAKAFGFEVDSMTAAYDSKLQLRSWSGTVDRSVVQIGDYVFASTTATHLTWHTGNTIEIDGDARNGRTGKQVSCVSVPADGSTPVECESSLK